MDQSVFLYSRAAIINEIELTVPLWIRQKCAGTWYPRYVHFLQVHLLKSDFACISSPSALNQT